MAVYKVVTRRGWEWQAPLKADGPLCIIIIGSTSVLSIIIAIVIGIIIIMCLL